MAQIIWTNQAEAEKVVSLVAKAGRKAIALQLDTGNVRTFDLFVQRVRDALADLGTERFDYLVNNAGISHHAAFDRTTEEELDSLYNVHSKGVFFLTPSASKSRTVCPFKPNLVILSN